MYDSADEQVRHWVVQTLLRGLEHDNGYKVYIEERDQIPVGCPNNEANYKAITNSQRTIVVLSQYFHQDQWKQDAVDQAYLFWKNHKTNKLIFILYNNHLQMEELQNELRALVYLKNYFSCLCIESRDRYFWRKVKRKMPKQN